MIVPDGWCDSPPPLILWFAPWQIFVTTELQIQPVLKKLCFLRTIPTCNSWLMWLFKPFSTRILISFINRMVSDRCRVSTCILNSCRIRNFLPNVYLLLMLFSTCIDHVMYYYNNAIYYIKVIVVIIILTNMSTQVHLKQILVNICTQFNIICHNRVICRYVVLP